MINKLEIEKRVLPYPYKGAMTISNDAEFMSFEFFETFYSFLNSNKKTIFGDGLGLQVTSSLFFYSNKPYNLSYFNGIEVNSPKNGYAQRLCEYLKAGWIDTNHAYGDFDGIGGFQRAHAIRVLEEMNEKQIQIPCFTNHGDTFNIQNIGIDALYHQGDIPDSRAYHADLLHQLGTRYVWTDSAVFARRTRRFLFLRISYLHLKPVIVKQQLQDGQEFLVFNRFRSTGANAPNLSSLGYQIEQVNLDELYQRRGIIVLYQHLGVLGRNGGRCFPATIEAVRSRPEVFLAPWYRLAREVHEGRLWLPALHVLLQYCEMLLCTRLVRREDNAIAVVTDREIPDPEEYFQGLTFYIDTRDVVSLTYCGRRLPIVYNGPDETGRYSVTVPLRKKEDIW
jgi:hypothetical protein